MHRCKYCKYGTRMATLGIGHHPPFCPERNGKFDVWELGWNDGRSGKSEDQNADGTYTLGFLAGEEAKEAGEDDR